MVAMGSTKIINVLKDDSFQEVFDLFKGSAADEVIFVLPKRSKAFGQEEHFKLVSAEAKRSGKTVSLLSENPQVGRAAQEEGFTILSGPTRKPHAPRIRTAVVTHKPPPEDETVHEQEDAFEQDVVVPSDEQVGLEPEPEEENEMEGMKIEEGESDISDIEEEPEQTAPASAETEEDAEFTEVPAEEPIATAVRTHPERGQAVSADIHNDPTRDAEINQLEQVWASERPSKSVWSDMVPKRTSWWSSLFRRSPSAPKVWNFSSPRTFRRNRLYWTLGIALAVVLGSVVFVWAGSALVKVTPQEKDLDFKISVQASDAIATIDVAFGKLPGQLFTLERTVSQTFSATGHTEVAQKARGTIAVFNAYGTAPQMLIATTRFESPDGLIFRTLKTVIVPGTKVENGTIIPGQIDVEIIADKAGKNYNISPARFIVPAFKEKGDAARYEKFYGQSTAPMIGGASGPATIITEADYTAAKEAVIKKLRDDITQTLASQASGLTIPDVSSSVVEKVTSDLSPDQTADVFTLTATGTLKTVGLKPDDVNILIAQYVDKSYDLVAKPDKVESSFADCAFKESKNSLECALLVHGVAYTKVDQEKIVSDLLGKPEQAIRDYLKSANGVGSATVILSPFWVRTIPRDPGRVHLEITY